MKSVTVSGSELSLLKLSAPAALRSDGMIERWENGHGPLLLQEEFAATGSGKDIAFGAMHMGATAVEAVEAAIRWDASCGGKVEVLP